MLWLKKMENDRLFKLLFHFATFVVYAIAFVYDTVYIPHGSRHTYGGRFKFLTFWNELIQMAFFGYSTINDLFGSNCKPPEKGKTEPVRSGLQKFRDLMVASIVFPTGAFVVITFWSIYFYDRELIFPKFLDLIVPAWLNHVWHTYVIVFLAMEKFFVYHHYPSRSKGLSITIIFGFTYITWIFWVAFFGNIWAYPILEVMDWPLRIVFCVACAMVFVILYIIGEFITRTAFGPFIEGQSKKIKQMWLRKSESIESSSLR